MSEIESELVAAAIDTIVSTLPDSTTLCLRILGGEGGAVSPGPELISQLQSRRAIASFADCPRTYASMVQVVDSLGQPMGERRPAGYVDPYKFSVGRPQFERPGFAWLHVRQLQGTVGRAYICAGEVYQRRATTRCRVVSRWIS
jgi:hypothetical protein